MIKKISYGLLIAVLSVSGIKAANIPAPIDAAMNSRLSTTLSTPDKTAALNKSALPAVSSEISDRKVAKKFGQMTLKEVWAEYKTEACVVASFAVGWMDRGIFEDTGLLGFWR